MKKLLLPVMLIASITFQSCSKPLEEVKLEKYDLTITMPKPQAEPEYRMYDSSADATEKASYDFNIGGHARVDLVEIGEKLYPTDVELLKKAVVGSEDYVETIETKQLKNGAFGIIFKKKGSNGTSIIKYYTFYFKKGNRYFRMVPVFNSELKDLDMQVAAMESLK